MSMPPGQPDGMLPPEVRFGPPIDPINYPIAAGQQADEQRRQQEAAWYAGSAGGQRTAPALPVPQLTTTDEILARMGQAKARDSRPQGHATETADTTAAPRPATAPVASRPLSTGQSYRISKWHTEIYRKTRRRDDLISLYGTPTGSPTNGPVSRASRKAFAQQEQLQQDIEKLTRKIGKFKPDYPPL